MKEIKDNLSTSIFLYLLIFMIFITSSYDIFLTINIEGFTFRITQLFCVILFILYAIKIYKDKKIQFPIGFKYLAIWAMFVLLFTFNTSMPKINIGYNLWLIFNILVIISFGNKKIVNENSYKKILEIYIFSFVFMAIIGIVQFILGILGIECFITQRWGNGIPRVNGFCYEPSFYSTYLILGWTMCRILLKNKEIVEYTKNRIYIAIALITFAIIISSSRMGILMLIGYELCSIIFNLLQGLKHKNKKMILKNTIVIVTLIIIGFLGLIIVSKSKLDFLLNGIGIGGNSSHSINEREEHFNDVLNLFIKSPILGRGLGGIYPDIIVNKGMDLQNLPDNYKITGSAICVFAEVLAASGIFGFIFFVTYLGTLLIKPLKLLNECKDNIDKSILLSLVVALFMEIIMLQFNQNILRPYVWLHIALLSVIYSVIKQKSVHNENTIYINGRFMTQRVTGVQRYAIEVVKQIDRMKINKNIVLLLPKQELANEIQLENIKIKKIGRLKGQAWEQISLPIYVLTHGENVDLVNLANIAPIIYPGYVTIQDISFKTHKDYFNWKFSMLYRIITRLNIKRYKKIFTGSNFAKNEILENYNIKEDKIIVCYNSAEHIKNVIPDDRILDKLKIKKNNFYFSIGSNSKNKNRAYTINCAKNNPDDVFVITGKTISISSNKETDNTPNNVILSGYLTDNEIASLYKNCKGFIYPSIYEGFGIPPLEAMECGCKSVYVSNIPVFKEIYGNSVNYIELNSKEQYILNINENKVNDIQRVLNKYSWENTAKIVVNEILKSNNNNIAVDARMVNMSGIGTYIQKLLVNNCYNIVLGRNEELEKFHDNYDAIINYDAKIYGVSEQLKFPYRELRKNNVKLLHVPHYNIPIFYNGKMIVTIHDLTHLRFPEYLPNKFSYYYAKFMIGLAIDKSIKVITDSENTKKDILEFYKVNEDKIEIIYPSINECFIKKDKAECEYLYNRFNIPKDKKVLMFVGNLKPHKNLERLLEAFSKIEEKENYCLLLVGKAFEKYNVLEKREKELNIQNEVIHTGIVSNEELVDLYNLVDLFVFPSLYEGFGLPVLEAMACGTRVVCSNNSSLPEVGGDAVTYFDATNIYDMKEKIEYALKSDLTDIEKEKMRKQLEKFKYENREKQIKNIIKVEEQL